MLVVRTVLSVRVAVLLAALSGGCSSTQVNDGPSGGGGADAGGGGGSSGDAGADAADSAPLTCAPLGGVGDFRYVFVTSLPLRGDFAHSSASGDAGGSADASSGSADASSGSDAGSTDSGNSTEGGPPSDAGSSPDAGSDVAHSTADEHCAATAAKTGLLAGKKWRAWISTDGLSAVDHVFGPAAFALPFDVRRPDGIIAFPQGFAFDGVEKPAPAVPLNVTELCTEVFASEVWTGSDLKGLTHPVNCKSWTDPTADGITGWVTDPTGGSSFADHWTSTGWGPHRACSELHRVYCFEVP